VLPLVLDFLVSVQYQVPQLAENGVLLVASAGNYAKEHRMEQFSDPDGDGDMDFPWGSSYLPMYFDEGPISVTLSWEQFRSCGRTDLDLYLYRQDGMLIGRAEAFASLGRFLALEALRTGCSCYQRTAALGALQAVPLAS
jgi:hypothetical protein